MRAMILSAGLGTRLKELTQTMPKALVPVKGKPIIDYVIKNLLKAGVDSFVINTHHFSEQIKDFIKVQNYPATFFFTYEPSLLDSGGAIKNAREFLTDQKNFILTNCDIYSDFNVEKLIHSHKKKDLATILTSKATSPRVLLFNEENNLTGWKTKDFTRIAGKYQSLSEYDYRCFNIIEPKIFEYFDRLSDKFSIFDAFLLARENNETLTNYDIGNAKWIDIGTIQDLNKANNE